MQTSKDYLHVFLDMGDALLNSGAEIFRVEDTIPFGIRHPYDARGQDILYRSRIFCPSVGYSFLQDIILCHGR